MCEPAFNTRGSRWVSTKLDDMKEQNTALPGIGQFRIDGHLAMITGGSKGLGFAMADGLASAGANVVLVSRHGDEAELFEGSHDVGCALGGRERCQGGMGSLLGFRDFGALEADSRPLEVDVCGEPRVAQRGGQRVEIVEQLLLHVHALDEALLGLLEEAVHLALPHLHGVGERRAQVGRVAGRLVGGLLVGHGCLRAGPRPRREPT